MDFDDFDMAEELEGILESGQRIQAIHRKIKEAVVNSLQEYKDLPTAHYVADLCLLQLVNELAKGRAEEETINRILEVWQSVGKIR